MSPNVNILRPSQNGTTSSWTPGGAAVIEMTGWLSRTTLDAIGEGEHDRPFQKRYNAYNTIAGFDYKFGALEDDQNELSRVYRNLMLVLNLIIQNNCITNLSELTHFTNAPLLLSCSRHYVDTFLCLLLKFFRPYFQQTS